MNNKIDNNLLTIKTELKKIVPKNAEVFLFWSRAEWNFKYYSDYDIWIRLKSWNKLDFNLFLKLIWYFDDYPFNIDIVDFNNVSEWFKKVALKKSLPLLNHT